VIVVTCQAAGWQYDSPLATRLDRPLQVFEVGFHLSFPNPDHSRDVECGAGASLKTVSEGLPDGGTAFPRDGGFT